MAKATFNGTSKLIIVDSGIIELDVKVDLYSDWKEWAATGDNAKYLQAMRVVGGDPTVGAKSVAPYFFLMNGWKVRPYEGNHILNVSGNLFVDSPETYGNNLFVQTLSAYNVLTNLVTTSDATILTVSTGSGLSTEEHNRLMDIPTNPATLMQMENSEVLAKEATVQSILSIVILLKKYVRNKKLIVTEAGVKSLIIYDDNGTMELVRKTLKDKDGNDISDIAAGILAIENASSV